MDCVRDELERRLENGAGIAEIESELVERTPELDDDERAGLWLFAWAYRPTREDIAQRVVSLTG